MEPKYTLSVSVTNGDKLDTRSCAARQTKGMFDTRLFGFQNYSQHNSSSDMLACPDALRSGRKKQNPENATDYLRGADPALLFFQHHRISYYFLVEN